MLRQTTPGTILTLLVLWLMLPAVARGQGQPPSDPPGRPGKNPKVEELFRDKTPLQIAIEKAREKRANEQKINPPCQAALDSGNEDDIAKFCKVPRLEMKKFSDADCGDCGELLNPAGKVVGHRVRTETKLTYQNPGQRGKSSWDKVLLKRLDLGRVGDGVSNRGMGRGTGPRARTAVLFPEHAVNEDKDCVDQVTGEHRGGYLNGQIPAAGAPESCFEVDGALKRTMVPGPGGCEHIASGIRLAGDNADFLDDPCFDENNVLKTSLMESIDEDGPEAIDDDLDGLVNEDPSNGVNDDHDCLDTDGNLLRDADCYDGGVLREGLTEVADEDGEDPVDQDGDGRIDEDPPAADVQAGCRNFGRALGLPENIGDALPDGTCDLNRAIVAALNRKARMPESEGGSGLSGRLFIGDENGECDLDGDGSCDPALADDLNGDGSPDSVEFGQDEMRKVKLTETFTLRCADPQAELIDGQCIATGPANPARFLSLDSSTSGEGTVAGPVRQTLQADGTHSLRQFMMMGFTFAPPVLEWGYKIEEFACVDLGFLPEICAEIFFARAGYEFDIAVGLRLPVEVEVTDIPSGTALAGQDLMLNTHITPLDFTARQYRDFCHENDLADGLLIADCDRFSFPSFLDTVNPFVAPEDVDGDEFVAHEVIFAGVIVRVLTVPVIQWGIDSAVDLPTMCSLLQMKDEKFNMVGFGVDLARTGDLRQAIKNQLINCASFTTPFGLEQDPNGLPGVQRLRAFPFSAAYDVRADCTEALVRGETVKIGKKTYPICTKMLLGANGASLGIGLGLEVSAGSTLITADWDTAGDSDPAAGGSEPQVRYRHSVSGGEDEPVVGPIRLDNYDGGPDQDLARISMDDFTYHLNALQLRLKADLEFGGILTPIPDLASFTVFNFVLDGNEFGIPIGQHAGTPGIEIPVFVKNYALDLDVAPLPDDPALLSDPKTLQIKPGEFGRYLITANNLGSVTGSFDRFVRQLSNRPDQQSPFTFTINRNTDFDCRDSAGRIFRGNPYDQVPDDCYAGSGGVRGDRVELIDEDPPGPAGKLESERDEDGDGIADEDPPDDWATLPGEAGFAGLRIPDVPAYGSSSVPPNPTAESLVISVSPFRHPLTAPGVYAFQVSGDSLEARQLGLAAVDPSGHTRLGAADVAFVEVTSFFAPKVAASPILAAHKPGVSQGYLVQVSNQGNSQDTILIAPRVVDFNQGGCTLATLGTDDSCPFRASPTAIAASEWTTLDGLPAQIGPLAPLGSEGATFQITPPRNWAGMQDTVYQVQLNVRSGTDSQVPPASNSIVVEHTVSATTESMTRYLGLEIDALAGAVEAADAQGLDTAGLLPILREAVQRTNDRALEHVLSGDLAGAARIHESNIRIVEGFLFALGGSDGKLPGGLADSWRAMADAILADVATASTALIPFAP